MCISCLDYINNDTIISLTMSSCDAFKTQIKYKMVALLNICSLRQLVQIFENFFVISGV